jgi:ABC-2 type transport system permease protein
MCGGRGAEVLRPAPVDGVRLATELGRTVPRTAVALAAGAAVALVLGAGAPDADGQALAVPALVLAALTNLAAQHAFAAIAFRMRDIRSTWFLYQKLVFILGGMLIPLQVLPEVARFLPFAAMACVPGRLLRQRCSRSARRGVLPPGRRAGYGVSIVRWWRTSTSGP